MTAYRRGYAAELRAKRILERRGYFVVRAAGSHGAADLVAVRIARCSSRDRCTLLVQVKRNAYLSAVERTALKHLKQYGQVECWRFIGSGKPLVEVL